MARFTVHLPKTGTRHERLERAIFVRDGFTFGAFALGGWWFIINGYILVATILFVAYGIFAVILGVLGLVAFLFPVTFLLAILLGLEAASLQRWALTRRGFTEAGVISGDAGDALEQRFFAQYLAQNPDAPPPVIPPAPVMGMAAPHGKAMGLFPQPDRPFSGRPA